jgi:hypothetical protein
MSNSTVFHGCSYTKGHGLGLEEADPNLWVNILHQQNSVLSKTTLVNNGVGGHTNEQIFLSAMRTIVNDPECQYLFVAFTVFKRMYVNPSVETYVTRVYLERAAIQDVNINPNVTISGSYIENIRDRFFSLTHLHYDVLAVLEYATLIAQAAKKAGIDVFFVNSLMWQLDQDYFNPVTTLSRKPSDTTPSTCELLNADTRDDEEYFKLYDKIHTDYKNTNALTYQWLNLDQSFRKNFFLDKGNDNIHPGPISHKAFGTFLTDKLQAYLSHDN